VTAAIAFQHVTVAVGGRSILADVDLTVAEGEFIGVLGANGSGKTTLMRAILGLVPPQTGRIAVLGKAATRGNAAIGYLPQTRSASPGFRLTGADFLASTVRGERWGMPILTADDRREIERVVEKVEARHLVGRPLSTLSGGERQRLLIAQALIGRPRLLLLDEPLISLDPHQQQAVVGLVQRLSAEMHLTVLFSAHELNQLLPAISRVLYLGNRQAALGTVDEVVTPEVMSRLYGAPIEIVRAGGRIFVLSNGRDVEHAPHGHHGHGLHHHADDAHVRL
jgi:zinc/manganese transport system ATP-binding protein